MWPTQSTPPPSFFPAAPTPVPRFLRLPARYSCERTSGAIQKGVPITVPRRDIVSPSFADTPKSASLIVPCSFKSRLPAFTSRCIWLRL
ncbi:hypothetical protein AB1Y20_005420 [Prymnesium parvum]|uniref:Uncharacterized protein n=1 Tax=Prymnesium parvum TaxID=97485 RepID=A0AB34J778_PRYPA